MDFINSIINSIINMVASFLCAMLVCKLTCIFNAKVCKFFGKTGITRSIRDTDIANYRGTDHDITQHYVGNTDVHMLDDTITPDK